MFENVRADIEVAARWYDNRLARRLFGESGRSVAVCLLSPVLQAVLLYRCQAWARRCRVPLLPNLCRRLAIMIAGVDIGDLVVIGPGLLLNHGQVVIDGPTVIGPLCSIAPFVTIGLDTGGASQDVSLQGPVLGKFVFVGTGAKILGPIHVGDNTRIGANAVVLQDVPDNSTAVGVPARIIPHVAALGPVAKP